MAVERETLAAELTVAERIGRLRTLRIEGMTIDSIRIRDASDQNGMPLIALAPTPELCCVQFTLKPTLDSRIGVELWIPTERWNGGFLGTGNGGRAGEINPVALIHGASMGFATANTDMGTTTDSMAMTGSFERIRDFGGRATHLMTVFAKRIVAEFQGREVEHSYFIGMSTGGQQALREAQEYPEDYDGIVALCPANNRVRLHASFVWNWRALTENDGPVITSELAAAVANRLVDKYGKLAGCAPDDTFLSYPDQVDIDWNILKDLLTDEQRTALRKVVEGAVDPVTKEQIFGGYSLGAALGDWYTTTAGRASLLELNFPFTWLWGAKFDPMTFDMHADYCEARERLSELLDARDPDLSTFRDRGGRLILLTGTADDIIPFHDAIEYYEQIVAANGGADAVDQFCRFFVVPGLGHGFGGPGAQDVGGVGFATAPLDAEHSVLLAVKAWVEQNRAPEQILPVRFKGGVLGAEVESERPVFPYPARTRYVAGDPRRADSFERVRN